MRAQISNFLEREVSLEPMFPNSEDLTDELHSRAFFKIRVFRWEFSKCRGC